MAVGMMIIATRNILLFANYSQKGHLGHSKRLHTQQQEQGSTCTVHRSAFLLPIDWVERVMAIMDGYLISDKVVARTVGCHLVVTVLTLVTPSQVIDQAIMT